MQSSLLSNLVLTVVALWWGCMALDLSGTKQEKCEIAIEACRRAKFKFPGRQKILKSMKWGFTNYDRETYVKGRQEKWLVATGSMVEYQDKHGRLGQTRATRYNNGHIVPY